MIRKMKQDRNVDGNKTNTFLETTGKGFYPYFLSDILMSGLSSLVYLPSTSAGSSEKCGHAYSKPQCLFNTVISLQIFMKGSRGLCSWPKRNWHAASGFYSNYSDIYKFYSPPSPIGLRWLSFLAFPFLLFGFLGSQAKRRPVFGTNLSGF